MTGTAWSLGWWNGAQGTVPVLDVDGCAWFVETVTGWNDGGDPRKNTIDRDGADGENDGPVYESGMVVTIDGWVEAPTQIALARALRRLRALLVAGNRFDTLKAADVDLALQALVRRDAKPLITPRAPLWAEYEMLLFAPDSTLYSATLNHASTGLYAGASGRVYPRVYPMAYGALGNQGYVTIHNGGNTDLYPLLTLTAPVNPLPNPQVRLVGGDLLRLGTTLNVGDVVVIDTANETVMLNGSTSRYYTLTADSMFFSCPVGDSQLLFTADSGFGAQLDVSWRDPYA